MDIGYYNLNDEVNIFVNILLKQIRSMNIEGDEYVTRSEEDFDKLIACIDENEETFINDISEFEEILENLSEDDKENFMNVINDKEFIIKVFSEIKYKIEVMYNSEILSEDKEFCNISKNYVDTNKDLEKALEEKKDIESNLNNIDSDNEDSDYEENELQNQNNNIDCQISDYENSLKDMINEYKSSQDNVETKINDLFINIQEEIIKLDEFIEIIKNLKKEHFKSSCYLNTDTKNLLNIITNIEEKKLNIKNKI